MAHWGIAMTLFQPLWPTRPGLAGAPAWLGRMVQKAEALAPPTERERLFIADGRGVLRRSGRRTTTGCASGAGKQASEKLYARCRTTPKRPPFYALAHLATAPADVDLAANCRRAPQILLRVYEANPRSSRRDALPHPRQRRAGARAGAARDHAQVRAGRATTIPHALHMPTHIYTRLGDWDAVIRGNLRRRTPRSSIPAGEHGELVWDEFPHAIEYLVYAYLQQGADEAARAQLERLHATERLEPTFKTAFHLASTRARYALERPATGRGGGARCRASRPSLDWDRFPWPEAIARFARGLGAARLGRAGRGARGRQPAARGLEATAARRARSCSRATSACCGSRSRRGSRSSKAGRKQPSTHAGGRRTRDFDPQARRYAGTDVPRARTARGPVDDTRTARAGAGGLSPFSLRLYPNRFNSLRGVSRAERRWRIERHVD